MRFLPLPSLARLVVLTGALLIPSVLLCERSAQAQSSSTSSTPGQVQARQAAQDWRSRHDALRAKAEAALAAERDRGRAGDCPNAESTRSEEECLSKEMTSSGANYAAFAGALRAMLADPYPQTPAEQQGSGPEGTPLSAAEQVAEFDRLEAQAKAYRLAAAKAAFDQYKGGSLAPVFSGEASQKLLRLHMEELAFVYGDLVAHH